MQGAHRRLLAAALVTWVALCAASWAKRDLTTNDFERLNDSWLLALFLALFTALLFAYGKLAELRPALPRRVAWTGYGALVIPAALTFPIGSKDIFLYVMYGKLWGSYGVNPHLLEPAHFAADSWYRYLQGWPDAPASLYGPVFTMHMALVYALSGGHLTVAVVLLKTVGVALVGVAAWLLLRLRAGASPGAAGDGWLPLWLWSPLVLFESVATPHNDIAMTVLVLAACWLWLEDRPISAMAVLTLAFWYKWYALMLVPAWVVWSLRRWGLRTWMWGALAAITGVSAFALLPFADGVGPMVTRALELHGVRQIFPDELPPPLWLLFHALDATGAFATGVGMAVFGAIRVAALVGGLAWIVWRRRAAAFRREAFLRDCLWSLVLFFALVPTQLWPWHLVVLCAFALATPGRGYELLVIGLTAAGLLSYFLTFAYALAVCALVAGALWLLRRPLASAVTPRA